MPRKHKSERSKTHVQANALINIDFFYSCFVIFLFSLDIPQVCLFPKNVVFLSCTGLCVMVVLSWVGWFSLNSFLVWKRTGQTLFEPRHGPHGRQLWQPGGRSVKVSHHLKPVIWLWSENNISVFLCSLLFQHICKGKVSIVNKLCTIFPNENHNKNKFLV